jgi:hypothetical protein
MTEFRILKTSNGGEVAINPEQVEAVVSVDSEHLQIKFVSGESIAVKMSLEEAIKLLRDEPAQKPMRINPKVLD